MEYILYEGKITVCNFWHNFSGVNISESFDSSKSGQKHCRLLRDSSNSFISGIKFYASTMLEAILSDHYGGRGGTVQTIMI
ncbi:MAG TPA: hypothetical protein DCR43_05170 [Bacteroidales bacterium]|nr:MAG: hypothetical protein A2X09_02410 [Bacteroidetes bacterium GWF2_43_11]HAQ65228.1 hypothetical protein [Bacteroidales bacterium]HBZ65566.1 hypothetical protein [Bacteroidales bacterium]